MNDTRPDVSFIIPAHNEEQLLPQALAGVHEAAGAAGLCYEVLVVNDDSSDRTREVALQHGARVTDVRLRQIAAVRNAGARQARGGIFIFVDADTFVTPELVAAALRALREGAVGGGARVQFDSSARWGRLIVWAWNQYSAWLSYAAGCFLFVRRTAFEQVGGFDERFYCAEELYLSRALRGLGRFVVLPQRVVTSGRKVNTHGMFELYWTALRLLLAGPRAWQKRDGLDLWYKRRAATGDR